MCNLVTKFYTNLTKHIIKIYPNDEVQKEVDRLDDRDDRNRNTKSAIIIKYFYTCKTEQKECLVIITIIIILLEKKPRIMMRKIIFGIYFNALKYRIRLSVIRLVRLKDR